MRLAGRVGLGTEVRGGRARLAEVAREDGLEEGAEDNLGATTDCEHLPNWKRRRLIRTRSGEETSRGRGRT